MLASCSVDQGRTLAEYTPEFYVIADGGVPSEWKFLAKVQPSDTGAASATDAGAIKDVAVADTTGDAGAKDTDLATDAGAPKDTAKPDIPPPADVPPPKDGCSGVDGAKYNINITNTSGDQPLTIAWNDIDCKEVKLGQIKPGKSANLGTKLNRWVIIKIGPNDDVIRSFRVTKTTSPSMLVP